MTKEPGNDLLGTIDRFFMAPADLRMVDVSRRLFGLLVLIYVAALWPDRHLFFGPGSYLTADAAPKVIDPDVWGLWDVFPNSNWSITIALALLALSGVMLIIGRFPRLAAAAAFFLFVCIQHGNIMLFDGEDIVFRLFAFFLIFVPPRRELQPVESDSGQPHPSGYPAWPMRLFQLQVCLIFFCTAIQKSNGGAWLDGTAVYYTLRLDDLSGFPLPSAITESIGWLKLLTWTTLLMEFLVPFLIWFRQTRWFCIVVALMFHLGTDYSMNLHLFHPVMMVGWLTFVRYDELQALGRRLRGRSADKTQADRPSAQAA